MENVPPDRLLEQLGLSIRVASLGDYFRERDLVFDTTRALRNLPLGRSTPAEQNQEPSLAAGVIRNMLSRYRNFARIGSGGMGVVYRAEDTMLERPVALKFLTGGTMANEVLRARFLREARMAAALNHPSICTIHEISDVKPGEEATLGAERPLEIGAPFIAMEYVEGQTLEALLRSSHLPLSDLLRIASGVAEAMAEAHSRGIVHRDLKPSNVIVLAGGRVKVLDFGLAKPVVPMSSDEGMTKAETLSEELTREGMVVGTAPYMSPEQALGKAMDSRSDIFSFGIVLYEMASGQRPFRGESPASTTAKILEAEPPPLTDPRLPPELLRIIRRCLRKSPNDRYNDTRDLVAAVKELREETDEGRVTTGTRGPSRRIGAWSLIGAAAVLVLAAGVRLALRGQTRSQPPVEPVHRQLTFSGHVDVATLSPDGQFFAYAETDGSSGRLLLRDVAGGRPLELARIDRAWSIEWSPDGSQLLVGGRTGPKRVNCLIPRLGGTPRAVPTSGGLAWSPDGLTIVDSPEPAKNLDLIRIDSGERRLVPVAGEFEFLGDIAWAPGPAVLVHTLSSDERTATLWTVSVDGRGQHKLREGLYIDHSARWSPSGNAVYYLADRGETIDLLKTRIDPATGAPGGEPSIVLSGLREASGISISNDGKRLLYTSDESQTRLWRVMLPASGKGEASGNSLLTSGTVTDDDPAVSPDGSAIAFARHERHGRSNIYLQPIGGGEPSQLSFLDGVNRQPAWSPDGRSIAFLSLQNGKRAIEVIPSAGGEPRVLLADAATSDSLVWAPDRRILYQRAGNQNFYWLDPETGRQESLFDESRLVGWEFNPVASPDGRTVAFHWNGTGRGIASVQVGSPSPRLLTVTEARPIGWSRDGEWILAIEGGGRLVKVPRNGGPEQVVLSLPVKQVRIGSMSPDGASLVVSAVESKSDAWLVDNFDPTP